MLIVTDACNHPLVTSRSFIELSGIDIPPSTPWAFYLLVLTNILNSAEISCEMWDIWDVARKKTALIYRDHPFGVTALAWSPDGTRIASCSWGDNIIRLWDVVTGNTLFTYHGHSDCVNAVVWSPDGTRVASGGSDKTVQVWDAVTGCIIFTYREHFGCVCAVAWSPDGTLIASAGNDGTVQVWQAV